MPLSMYQASVPVFIHALTALSGILDKAAAHAETRRIDPTALLQARLFPDMFPLTRQVQSSSDTAKAATARLAAIEIPRFADTETSFSDLKTRIAKTVDFVRSVDARAIDGFEERPVVFVTSGRERTMTAQAYLFGHALPNFFFHVSTAYGILRHNGVELGKRDYLAI
jgi:hypothetical protein